ncbi:TMEM43 family protein [Oleiagrimonas sp. C23AA]|uniref:TMEM43 family protein n=1 Tax=Oleiagrimonas sp. C23AA TaxID=2719047 RepID=UPI00141EBD54|nr:TMEM43 family protein [Oleiagrimonas sp. C23AA]NII11565.1 hypothetical protein [Oleiagrimonas sp. C23AA]
MGKQDRDGRWTQPWMLPALGVIVLFIAGAVLAVNEQRVLGYRNAAAHHGGVVDDLGSTGHPGDAGNGRMVRVDGMPQIVQAPRDPQFNVSAEVTTLHRKVEMFQWRQVTVGGQTHYELDWVDHPVDSSKFKQPQGHRNPGHFPFSAEHYLAPKVTLNGFSLTPAMVASLGGYIALKPDFDHLPPNLAASFQPVDGTLVTSSDPLSPRLGDLRVSWEGVPPQIITVVARTQGRSLVAADSADDGVGYQVQIGNRELGDILPDLPPAPRAPMLWRLLALMLAWVGGALVLLRWARPGPAMLGGLFVGGAALSALAGALWLGVQMRYGAFWLMVVALCAAAAAAIVRRGRRLG